MRSKFIAISLAVILLAGLFSGCSSNEGSQGGVEPQVSKPSETEVSIAEPEVSNDSGVTYEAIAIRLADSDDKEYPLAMASQYFSDYLKKATNGAVSVECFFAGTLGEEPDTVESLNLGLLEMTRISCGAAAAYVPELDIFNLPFLFENEEHFWRVLDGEVGQIYEDLFEKNNLKLITFYFEGIRNMFSTKSCITSVAEIKGVKVRTMGAQSIQDAFSAMGALPVPMNSGEVYTSLSQGVIDACENNYSSITDHMWYEAAPYFSNTNHLMVPCVMLCSLDYWNSLQPETQTIIMEAADAARDYANEIFADLEQEAFDKIIASGAEYKELTDDARMEFTVACEPVYDKYRAIGLNKEIFDIIESLR